MALGRKMGAVLALVLGLPVVSAHIALWHPSMYGWDPNNPNQQDPIYPLADMTFNEWWFHGYINQPPAPGVFMELPAGGTFHGEVACNKALTSFGAVKSQQTGVYACDQNGDGGGTKAMHTTDTFGSPNPQNVKGCGIAIAYEADVQKIQPEDFTVISVNYTCPWFKDVDFPIPADLPKCPPGGCHCMWGWVHSVESGSQQIYFNGFRCNVTGARTEVPLPQAQIANKCPVDKSNCTVGPKQPHYWLQKERNNNHQDYYDPPFYNGDYGFMNGAQTDLFANTNATVPSSSPPSVSLVPSVTPSATTILQPSPTSTTSQPPADTTSVNSPAATPPASQGHCKRRRDLPRRVVKRHRRRSLGGTTHHSPHRGFVPS